MIGLLFLQGATPLPASTPWPWALGGTLLLALLNTIGLVLVARRKAPPAPKATEDLGTIRTDLKAHGSAIAELRALLVEIEARGPGASPAQVKLALGKISALEAWKKERDASDERRRATEHEQDKTLERLLGRFEAKLEILEREDRDGRRSRV